MTSQISPVNQLNDLSGDRWLYFTKSLLCTTYPHKYGHELRKAHGANKPPQLLQALIEFFTKPESLVLDPFGGVGSTLIGASICEQPRKAIGIEINPKWIDIYNQVIASCDKPLIPQTFLLGDCLQIMQTMQDCSFDYIVTDPPYNIHLKQTMVSGNRAKVHANRRTDYNMHSAFSGDLANLPDYTAYLEAMENVFAQCARVLKPKKYLTFIIRNAYQNGEYIFTHVDLARLARRHGLIPKGEILWSQAGTRLRPYGYPFSFVPNIAHQYIVILRKDE